ncbi:hypothetical protein [Helicobacter winghamensis]|uniref:ABC transporter C-terminal domain-containing protein n=1 Tax=Helicobacter winghamensis TaxID=157268 RepID=UPI003F86605E
MELHRSFSEYLEIQSELREYAKLELESKQESIPKNPPKEVQKKTKLSYHEKRLLEILPQEIEALETELKALENLLYNGSLSTQELQEKSKEFEEKKAICEAKILQYLELEEKEATL